MYKIFTGLTAALLLLIGAISFMFGEIPTPTANTVLAEKSAIIQGGQIAVLVPKNLSNAQFQLLNEAYSIAKADGHKSPEIVQGILLQETKAGGMDKYKVAGNAGDQYYGLMQLKVGAARDVMSRFPTLWSKYAFHTRTDDELKANLILNNHFNMEIGSKYLLVLQKDYGFTGRELMNAYNRGPGGVKAVGADWHYAIGAEQKLAALKLK